MGHLKRITTALIAVLGVVGVQLATVVAQAPPAKALTPKALINADTVAGACLTGFEGTLATGDGFAVTCVSGATWDSMTEADFRAYQVLIIGDPDCGAIAGSVMTNVSTWTKAVMDSGGNRFEFGSDPYFHSGGDPTNARAHATKDGIKFAGAVAGATGAYVDTTCEADANNVTILDRLSLSGTGWSVERPACAGNIAIVATNPFMVDTHDSDLSNWFCSSHSDYPSFATDWVPFAISADAPTKKYCATDIETKATVCGEPYILMAGAGTSIKSDISLSPATATNPVGTDHTVVATVVRDGVPESGKTVTFTVSAGPNAGKTGSAVTNSMGHASFTYHDDGGAGTDTIVAKFTNDSGAVEAATASKTWSGGGIATPTIKTAPSGSVRVGGTVSDTATLVGGASPTGTITFTLFGPGDTTCKTPVATKVATVVVAAASSGPVTVTAPGTYLWEAVYSGDAHNKGASSTCGSESVLVRRPHTTLTTTPGVKSGTFTVTFTYTETNDGTDPIGGVALSDTLCAPVTFVSGDTDSNGILDPGETWTYTCTHAFIGPGPWTGTATATGTDTIDKLPAPVETATSAVTVPCDHNITGTVPTSLILGPGTWCIVDADVAGAIVINPGAAVFIGHSTIHGAISASGATSFAMCGDTALAGSNTLRNSTGFIVIGDPTTALDDGCASNTISGSLTLLTNHAGAEVIGNSIGGSLSVSGTTGTGPFPEDSTVEIEGNTISGALTCNGNVPPPTDEADPNTASSRPGSQCTGAF